MGLNSIDLNLLVALDALLTERHVTRAAERTTVGQAAMSASLARLRKHFGDPLLVKEGRKLVPTARAESLVQPVREAIAAVEGVMGAGGHRQGFDPGVDHRTFTILASDYVTFVLLRPLLAELAVEAPDVRIDIVPVQEDFVGRLRSGRLDLMIMPTVMMEGQSLFPHQRLFEDRFVLAADRGNSAVVDGVTARDFAGLPSVTYDGGSLKSLVETQLDALGVPRRVDVTTASFVISPFLLTGTRLVSIVHERLARSVREEAQLRMLPAPVPLRPVIEAMYWNPHDNHDPAHCWLRERLFQLARKL